jgi:hypothetical protein
MPSSVLALNRTTAQARTPSDGHRLPNAERYTQKPGVNLNYTFYFQIYSRVYLGHFWHEGGSALGHVLAVIFAAPNRFVARLPRHHSRPETAISPSILHLQFAVSGVRGSPPCTSMHVARCMWILKEKKNTRISGLTSSSAKCFLFPHRPS